MSLGMQFQSIAVGEHEYSMPRYTYVFQVMSVSNDCQASPEVLRLRSVHTCDPFRDEHYN